MDVRFYKTEAGHEPVKEYLRPLAREQRVMVGGVIRAIQDRNTMPASAKSIRGKLCELSVGFHRIFYVMTKGPTMHLLHAYQKDSQKTPATHMKVARDRMQKVLAK